MFTFSLTQFPKIVSQNNNKFHMLLIKTRNYLYMESKPRDQKKKRNQASISDVGQTKAGFLDNSFFHEEWSKNVWHHVFLQNTRFAIVGDVFYLGILHQ